MSKKTVTLGAATDPRWTEVVLGDFNSFLCDHANCERKASALAMSMVVKYPDRELITADLIALAREELAHFDAVYALMRDRRLSLVKDTPDAYVNALVQAMRHGREQRFLDRLLISSLVECRGAERFGLVAAHHPDPELAGFYRDLFRSETKHAQQFALWALRYYDAATVDDRLLELSEIEAEVISRLPLRAALH